MDPSRFETPDDWIFGANRDSEICRLIRAKDWSQTSLGPLSQWPPCLKSALSMCLTSNFPIVLWLGPDRNCIYNEGYASFCGTRHPARFGLPGSEYWPEIWEVIGPMLKGVFETAQATWMRNHLLVLQRWGYPEETYWTYSYSPIISPDGLVRGVFTANEDTTLRYLGERRLRTLRELSARLAEADGLASACSTTSSVLAQNPYDVPFALLYLNAGGGGADGGTLSLQATTGVPPGVFPSELSLSPAGAADPIAAGCRQALQSGQLVVSDLPPGLGLALGRLPPWDDEPKQLGSLPLAGSERRPLGLLLVGINTRRLLDEDYRTFFTLAASQVAAALLKARALEEETRRAQTLAELDRAKTVFFGNISHEFRTPLTLMLGPLEELLADGGLSVAQLQSLALVHRNGLRLLKLVNVLLDFSRIEAGRVQATYRPTDLAALTAELASVFRAAFDRAGVRLLVRCDTLPEPVFVDPDMWEKVVFNLLSNAYKYTLEGEVEVRLEPDAAQQGAVLTIRDTGCGIPAAEMPRLFERFHRIQHSRGRSHEGTGIGLALVYELVRLHGGTIRAESEAGRGATFVVRVPFGSAHLPPGAVSSEPYHGARHAPQRTLDWWIDSSSSSSSSSSASTPSPAGAASDECTALASANHVRGARVLVADDNADMLGYVTRLLVCAGFQVLQARDGLEALQLLQSTPVKPDLVISDVMMPKLDGLGLLSAVRQAPDLAQIPVMLLSARAGGEASSEGLAAGADDYVYKPFSAKELVTRAAARIELSRQRSAAAVREQELRTQAERALAVKDRFLAVLSHELRTPLAPALLLAEEAQQDEELPERVRADLVLIVRQMRLQMQLIDDLLDVTRIRQGKLQLQAQPVDLHLLLSHTVDMFRTRAEDARIHLQLSLGAARSRALGDPTRLQQIFWNLLSNALKFTPAGGRVSLATSLVREDAELWQLEVSDTGIGIEAAALPRLFSAFEQGSNEIPRTFGGLGLGLHICKSLAALHGGTIEARSEGRGRGATFILSLPLQPLDEAVATPQTMPRSRSIDKGEQADGAAPATRPLRVLLVEDNAVTATVMARLLRRRGHIVVVADSCAEALRAAAAQPNGFDVLLCDVGLPDGSGHELLAPLRLHQPGLHAIALTGFGREEDRRRSFEVGFEQHLTKPISRAQLDQALAAVA